jgi:hypothetical protein
MASVYDKYYEQQPPAVKVIVVAGLGLLGYSIYRSIRRKQDEADALKAAQAAAIELGVLQNKGITPSYTDSQFETWANALVQAMNGCGTDEQAIFDVIDWMANEADIRKLITVFGLRYIEPCGWHSPVEYLVYSVNDKAYGGDLTTWLYYELSSSEIAKVNEILGSKGISFRF